jgi:metal-responsive CopG/Arc/MetJ family transcriptional regulator
MITSTQIEYDRITFSLPQSMNIALDNLKSEIKRSKSEIIKLAIESYLAQQKKLKLQRAVEMMASEYENSDELTEFTVLDSEDFL